MAIIAGGLINKVEKPTGTINGVNAVFTTSLPYVPGTLLVFRNGIALTPGVSEDYTETTTTTFTFNAGCIPGTEGSYIDKVLVTYQIA